MLLIKIHGYLLIYNTWNNKYLTILLTWRTVFFSNACFHKSSLRISSTLDPQYIVTVGKSLNLILNVSNKLKYIQISK